MIDEKVAEILLVEDSAEDAELTVNAIHERIRGNNVIHFLDGDEVLDFICGHSWSSNWKLEGAPRLILLDLKLSRIGGLEVLQQLKVRESTRPIPVVVFTGSHNGQEMLESYRLGANSYVVKPPRAADFARLVGDIAHYWLVVNHPLH